MDLSTLTATCAILNTRIRLSNKTVHGKPYDPYFFIEEAQGDEDDPKLWFYTEDWLTDDDTKRLRDLGWWAHLGRWWHT